jgi:hypothetical protein
MCLKRHSRRQSVNKNRNHGDSNWFLFVTATVGCAVHWLHFTIWGVPLATEPGISLIILPLAGGPLLRVATIRLSTDTFPLRFSHNERTPVQVSLQYLQCRVR